MSEPANNPEPTGSQELAPEADADGSENLFQDTGSADTSEGTEGDEDGQGGDASGDDDFEEIELDGEKFSVPPALKKALTEGALRQDDYTRKTQALAEDRKAFDTQRVAREQELQVRAETATKLREEIAKVGVIEQSLKRFEGVDWRAAQAEIRAIADPTQRAEAVAQYNLAWNEFSTLERDLNQAKADLANKEQAFAHEQTQRVQAAMRDTLTSLAQEIKGFDVEYANKIVEHGVKGFGLTVEEARQMADPRIWKLLDSDRTKAAEIEKLKAENAKLKGQRTAQDANKAAQQVKPVRKVGGSAPATSGPRDDMSVDEWMRREQERVDRKRARA